MQEKRDMYIGIIGAILGAVYAILALNMSSAMVGSARGHTYLPLGVGVIMVVVGLILFIKNYKKVKAVEGNIDTTQDTRSDEPKHFKLIAITVVMSALYAYIFDRLGYIISTSLFIGIMLFILRGFNKWISNILIAVGFSYFIFYVFGNFLQIYLPTL